jgi:hypothetical protein
MAALREGRGDVSLVSGVTFLEVDKTYAVIVFESGIAVLFFDKNAVGH